MLELECKVQNQTCLQTKHVYVQYAQELRRCPSKIQHQTWPQKERCFSLRVGYP